MSNARDELPNLPTDPDALRALALSMMSERDALVVERDQLLQTVERQQHLIWKLNRLQFGRKSERLPEDHRQLGFEDLEQAIAQGQAEQEKRDPEVRERRATERRANRGALPTHLPRIEITLPPGDTTCPCCRAAMTMIGEDKSERLDVIPAQYRVIVTRRPKFACRACEGTIVQEAAPPRLIEGGIPTEALVSHVAIARYADHQPLYRQSQIMARQGVMLDRSTLASWMGYAAAEVAPVVARLRELVLASGRVFADETVYQYLTQVADGPSRATSGRLRATIAPGAGVTRRRSSTPMRQAGDIITRKRCLVVIAAFCSATGIGLISSWRVPQLATLPSRWRFAGAICAVSSTISPRLGHRSRRRRCHASRRSIKSRQRSAARVPTIGWPCARQKAGRWWRTCTPGSLGNCQNSSAAARPQTPSATR